MESVDNDEIFISMKHDYRVSRNARTQWYLDHIGRPVCTCGEKDVCSVADSDMGSQDFEVVGVLPSTSNTPEPKPSGACDSCLVVRDSTLLTFLARRQRLVIVLDISPSAATCENSTCSVVLDQYWHALEHCLRQITEPFSVPGSRQPDHRFHPHLYITVVAHSSFYALPVSEVLIQCVLASAANIVAVLRQVGRRFFSFLKRVRNATISHTRQRVQNERRRRAAEKENVPPREDSPEHTDAEESTPSFCLDASFGFEMMMRKALLAIQLLPENTSASIVVITDGGFEVSDIQMLDGLLSQLRNYCIGCSFISLGERFRPDCSFGMLADDSLMRFLSTATFGAYITLNDLDASPIAEQSDFAMNIYHRLILSWTFRRSCHVPDLLANGYVWNSHDIASTGSINDYPIRRRHGNKRTLNVSLPQILSVRIREGFIVKSVEFLSDSTKIRIELMLPYHSLIFLLYSVTTDWPLNGSPMQVELIVDAALDILRDLHEYSNSLAGVQQFSTLRRALLLRFRQKLQSIEQSDRLLVQLHDFNADPQLYTVAEGLSQTLFYKRSNAEYVVSVRSYEENYPEFCAYWQRVCMLDIDVWQKWFHTHRIGLILTHDTPLPSHLHTPAPDGCSFNIVSCKSAKVALSNLLEQHSSFTLVDNHSYIKFVYPVDEDAPKVPLYFYVIRLLFRPPNVMIRVAFLAGVRGADRQAVVRNLQCQIARLVVQQKIDARVIGQRDGYGSPVKPAGRVSQTVSACALMSKPIEKILIQYGRPPRDRHRFINMDVVSRRDPRQLLLLSMSDFNMLARYLHHVRSINYMTLKRVTTEDSVQPLSLSMTVCEIVLETLTRARLREGFHFVTSSDGIVSLALELQMDHCGAKDRTEQHPALVQYILFPPTANSVVLGMADGGDGEAQRGSSSVVNLEGSTEADSETVLMREAWIEPQHGCAMQSSPFWARGQAYAEVLEGLMAFDRRVIAAISTLHYLEGLVTQVSATRQYQLESAKPDDTLGDGCIKVAHSCFSLECLLQTASLATLTVSCLSHAEESIANEIYSERLTKHLHAQCKYTVDLDRDTSVAVWRQVCSRNSATTETDEHCRAWMSVIEGLLENDIDNIPLLTLGVEQVVPGRLWLVLLPLSPVDLARFSTQSYSYPVLVYSATLQSTIDCFIDSPERFSHQSNDFSLDLSMSDCDTVLSSLHRQVSQSEGPNTNLEEAVLLEDSDFRSLHHFCFHLDDSLLKPVHINAVYQCIIQDVTLSKRDVLAALDQDCEEQVAEIDMTRFVSLLCGHFKECSTAVDRETSAFRLRSDTFDSQVRPSDVERSRQSSAPPRMDPVCDDVSHKQIRQQFSQIIQQHFKPVPGLPHYLYYVPQEEEDQDVTLNPTDVPTDVTLNPTDANENEPLNADDVMSASLDDLLESASQAIRRLSGDVASLSVSTDGSAHGQQPGQTPLFMQMIIAVRCGGEVHTCSMITLPTCLADLAKKCHCDSLVTTTPIQVFMYLYVYAPVLRLTSPSPEHHLDQARSSIPSPVDAAVPERPPSRRSWTAGDQPLPDPRECRQSDTPYSLDSSVNVCMYDTRKDDDLLCLFGREQSGAIRTVMNGVRMLLEVEVMFALRNDPRNTEETLDSVVSVVKKLIEQILVNVEAKFHELPLTFLLNEEDSLEKLKEEILTISLGHSSLVRVGDGYYVVESPDGANNAAEPKTIGRLSTCEEACIEPDAQAARYIAYSSDSSTLCGLPSSFPSRTAVFACDHMNVLCRCSSFACQSNSPPPVPSPLKRVRSLDRFNDAPFDISPFGDNAPELTSALGSSVSIATNTSVGGYIAESDDNESAAGTKTRKHSRVSEFWLLLRLADSAQIYYLERMDTQQDHGHIFDLLTRELEGLWRRVNQSFLLKDMHERRQCSVFLMPEQEVDVAQHRRQPRISVVSTSSTDTEDLSAVADVAIPIREQANFPAGHFACPCVFYYCFHIHPRLQSVQQLGEAVPHAVKVMRSFLHIMAVTNRPNLYSYLNSAKAYFYLHLHYDPSQIDVIIQRIHPEALKFAGGASNEGLLTGLAEMAGTDSGDSTRTPTKSPATPNSATPTTVRRMGIPAARCTTVVLACHGIEAPRKELCQDLIANLQHELDQRTLYEIVDQMSRNVNLRLSREDVLFIQPRSLSDTAPSFVLDFFLPNTEFDHLYAVNYYLRQQLLQKCSVPHFQDPTYTFRTYVQLAGKACSKSESYCLLYRRKPAPGSTDCSLALLTVAIVNNRGLEHPLDHFASMSNSAHMNLELSSPLFDDLTKTRSFRSRRTEEGTRPAVPMSPITVQVAVWARGDVEDELTAFLKHAVESAFCDRISEFWLLTAPLMEEVQTDSEAMDDTPENGLAADSSRNRHQSQQSSTPPNPQTSFKRPNLRNSSTPAHMHAIQRKTSVPSITFYEAQKQLSSTYSAFNSTFFLKSGLTWLEYVTAKQLNPLFQKMTWSLPSFLSEVEAVDELKDFINRHCHNLTNVSVFERDKATTRYIRLPLTQPNFLSHDGCTSTDLVLLVQSQPLKRDFIDMSLRKDQSAAPLHDSFKQFTDFSVTDYQRALPQLPAAATGRAPHLSFVPRQRFALIRIRNRQIVAYLYNWAGRWTTSFTRLVNVLVAWQRARHHLFTRSCLHKLGMKHILAKPAGSSKTETDYLRVCWTHPLPFVRDFVPSSQRIQMPHPMPSDHTPWALSNLPIFLPLLTASQVFSAVESTLPTLDVVQLQCNPLVHICEKLQAIESRRVALASIHSLLMAALPSSIDSHDFDNLLQRARLVHSIATPVMFMYSWRQVLASVRLPKRTVLRAIEERRKSSDIIHTNNDEWHLALVKEFVEEYESFLQYTFGMKLLRRNDLKSEEKEREKQAKSIPTVLDSWWHVSLPGGIVLLCLSISVPYCSVSVYVVDSAEWNQMRSDSEFAGLMSEVERIIHEKHLHSFCYDFHLRSLYKFHVDGYQIFRRHYHFIAFLEDFRSYYTCRPPFARNYIHFRDIVIESDRMSVSPEQLFNFLLANNHIYGYSLHRMRALLSAFDDPSPDNQDDFVLVTSDRVFVDVQRNEPYAVVHLLTSSPSDQSHPSGALALRLYLVFISLRSQYPSGDAEVDLVKAGYYETFRPPKTSVSSARSSVPSSPSKQPSAAASKSSSTTASTLDLRAGSERPSQLSTMRRRSSTIFNEKPEKPGQPVLASPIPLDSSSSSNSAFNTPRPARGRFAVSKVSDSALNPAHTTNPATRSNLFNIKRMESIAACMEKHQQISGHRKSQTSPNTIHSNAVHIAAAVSRPLRRSGRRSTSKKSGDSVVGVKRRNTSVSETALADSESVTYMAYMGQTETRMKTWIKRFADDTETFLDSLIDHAQADCRRETLWSRVVRQERSGESAVSYAEFRELILKPDEGEGFVSVASLRTVSRLAPLMDYGYSKFVQYAQTLQQKYNSSTLVDVGLFNSDEKPPTRHYLIVSHKHLYDTCLVFVKEDDNKQFDIRQVSKPELQTERSGNATEQKKRTLFSDFLSEVVSVLCYVNWVKLMKRSS